MVYTLRYHTIHRKGFYFMDNICSLNRKKLVRIVSVAIIIKLVLFAVAFFYAPESKFMPDTDSYLKPGLSIISHGSFSERLEDGSQKPVLFRTPGYPLFLGFLNGLLKIPLAGVIFLQIVLTVIAAFITYKTANLIDRKIALLSMLILLFDPPVSVFSLMLLSETLFLFSLSVFMLFFVKYLKTGKLNSLIYCSLAITVAAYIRPIGYYLGPAVAVFIIYFNVTGKFYKKALFHALILLAIVHLSLGAWQLRNHKLFNKPTFCSVIDEQLETRNLFKSYATNRDPHTQDMNPLPYYINVTFRSWLSLMTRPGSLKLFKSDPIFFVGNVFLYPWMLFWLTGFIFGVIRIRNNLYYQGILTVILYFTATSIIAALWVVGERFRVPMMPFIAIISAYGWLELTQVLKKSFPTKKSNK